MYPAGLSLNKLVALVWWFCGTRQVYKPPPNFYFLRLMFDSREEIPLAYQPDKCSCIILLLHALSLLKKSFQERENRPNSEKEEREEE